MTSAVAEYLDPSHDLNVNIPDERTYRPWQSRTSR